MSELARIMLLSAASLVCISATASTLTPRIDSVFSHSPATTIGQTPGSTLLPGYGDTSTPYAPGMTTSTADPAHRQATPARTLSTPTAAILLGCILLGLGCYIYFRQSRDLT